MNTINVSAKIEYLDVVNSFISDFFKDIDCSQNFLENIFLVVEEVFVNVASYAYENSDGDISVGINFCDDMITLSFSDTGTPFNPIRKIDVDFEFDNENRPRGGLGIFLIENLMDNISYEYKDSKNILTLKKKLT